jgi:hypothetical protein
MKTLICITIMSLCFINTYAMDEEWRFGSVRYPLYGNLNSEEGTIICRFRIDEDLATKKSPCQPKKFQQWNRFMVFRVSPNSDSHMMLFWKPGKTDPGCITVSLKTDGKSFLAPRDRNGKISGKWRQGQTYTAAITWTKDKTFTLWLDGVQAEKASGSPESVKALGEVDKTSAYVELGGSNSSSAIAIYALHILDRPLNAEELGNNDDSLFAVHPASLLLDTFGGQNFVPDGKQQTEAKVISAFSGERGGVPDKNCSFDNSTQPSPLKLYRVIKSFK